MFSGSKVVGGIVSFILLCQLFGRSDIPIRIILYMQSESLKVIDKPWGYPSVFNKGVCKEYALDRYR